MQCQDEQKDQAWPNTLSKVGLPKIQHHYPAQEMKNASDRLHKSEATVVKEAPCGLQGVVRRWRNR